jgi:hypothetical protein
MILTKVVAWHQSRQRCVKHLSLPVGLPEPASEQSWCLEHLNGICSFLIINCFTPGMYNKEIGYLAMHRHSHWQESAVRYFPIVSWQEDYCLLLLTCTTCNTTTVDLHEKSIKATRSLFITSLQTFTHALNNRTSRTPPAQLQQLSSEAHNFLHKHKPHLTQWLTHSNITHLHTLRNYHSRRLSNCTTTTDHTPTTAHNFHGYCTIIDTLCIGKKACQSKHNPVIYVIILYYM